ncbi:MAG: hypothetical protein ABF703_07280 [Oenococcus sp.]|uniref:hypothetical protein n=1 Tax=Oenococcus TaxID=46254 RepID=UPI0021E77812|nr:hypothetical protein [Oenococcus kitaharae]MCV3296040.1 hypothetical protein [Oenococcus kitaharae]
MKMKNTSKRTWRFLYDALLYPLLIIVAAVFLIMTAQLLPFTASEKLTISVTIILILLVETIIVTYHLLKKDGFVGRKKSKIKN